MPGAVWQGEHGSLLMKAYDIVCVHTIVGYAPAHAAHFSTKADGRILQSRDTQYQSGANLDGNPRVIAIENEDHGSRFPSWSGPNVPYLTPEQVTANARILAWVHETHGVPLQLCPDSRPGSRGLAYHRQGIDGNFDGYKYPGRVQGGEVWSTSTGKACPGDRRISQLPDILAQVGDDDVSAEEVWAHPLVSKVDGQPRPAADVLGFAQAQAQSADTKVTDLAERVAALEELVSSVPQHVWEHLMFEQISGLDREARQMLNGAHYWAYVGVNGVPEASADSPDV